MTYDILTMQRLVVVCIFLIWKFQTIKAQDLIVNVEQGQLRGSEANTDFELKYYRFLGIPYAKPPVGVLRFKAPEPAEPWDGIYNAQQLGASCQVEEDCLYLNVATPKLPSDGTLLPTIVYIHGGSFLAGSGGGFIEWSDYYLQNDIVFVSINYRLGPLGFLSTGDSVVPGNNGLKDQNFALRWVKQNIAQFGGDPSRITICGLSAGGASIHYQLLSPLSKGLFQGAIAESGSALNPWSFDETSTARSRTLRYGQALLANTNDSQTLVDYLRTLSFQELLDGVQITMTELEKNHDFAFFAPTVEQPSESGEENFLPEHPLTIMAQGTFNHVPFITGTVSQEGMLQMSEVFLNPEKFEYYNNNFDLVLPRNLALDKNTSLQVAEVVKKFYFGDKKLSQETLIQYINFLGDTQFVYGVNAHAWAHAMTSTAPVYQYYFKYPGRLGDSMRNVGDYYPGVTHGDEEGYIFYSSAPFDQNSGPENEVRKRMIALWTNFIKTGNPTPEPDPLLQNVTWRPITEFDHVYLDIGNDLIVLKTEVISCGDNIALTMLHPDDLILWQQSLSGP